MSCNLSTSLGEHTPGQPHKTKEGTYPSTTGTRLEGYLNSHGIIRWKDVTFGRSWNGLHYTYGREAWGYTQRIWDEEDGYCNVCRIWEQSVEFQN
ncbi:hypothetical protein N7517_008682 [Penicillium concentricum]|uniref:Uncharacterized protein n=1 Tax=Penicillium concentricum TaxID=293559 RepID=A0A9W9RT76_9EURO|nr:uncharacterized protein N7517_008682 [Penicillium concentricum]KAJ5365796.1 hypothetical protein N7517_008682 [Penicillium concentricum]